MLLTKRQAVTLIIHQAPLLVSVNLTRGGLPERRWEQRSRAAEVEGGVRKLDKGAGRKNRLPPRGRARGDSLVYAPSWHGNSNTSRYDSGPNYTPGSLDNKLLTKRAYI
jgi:hypothetical protein